jgi:hypothetical protein
MSKARASPVRRDDSLRAEVPQHEMTLAEAIGIVLARDSV